MNKYLPSLILLKQNASKIKKSVTLLFSVLIRAPQEAISSKTKRSPTKRYTLIQEKVVSTLLQITKVKIDTTVIACTKVEGCTWQTVTATNQRKDMNKYLKDYFKSKIKVDILHI